MNPLPPTHTTRTQANAFQQFMECQANNLVLSNEAPKFLNLHHESGMRLHVPTEVFPFLAPGDRVLVTLAIVKTVIVATAPGPLDPPGIPLLGGPQIIGGH